MADDDDRAGEVWLLSVEARGRTAIFLLFTVGMLIGALLYALGALIVGLL